MDCSLNISSISLTNSPSPKSNPHRSSVSGVKRCRRPFFIKISANSDNGSISRSGLQSSSSSAVGDVHRQISSLESLFCYDKAVPEEIIEKPIGLSLSEKAIGMNTRCTDCQAKGAVLCATCSGSGLYVDSILESQGIIVKVRCLGCGGTGNIMCSDCGGRGHLGHP